MVKVSKSSKKREKSIGELFIPFDIDLKSEEFKKKIEGKELWLITTDKCEGCEALKKILEEEKISYKEINAYDIPQFFDILKTVKEENIPALLVAQEIEEGKYLVCNPLVKEDKCAIYDENQQLEEFEESEI
jgi:glutaredoxin